jgi:putative salt-induced outer membrane protein YdiY
MGGVSLKLSYTYRYNSHPEENKKKVDTELGATLVYSF